MTARGLIIAAPGSGSGKTTIALGLMRALRKRGFRVRGLKNGPDYIDPAFHRAATGTESYNLDSFAMPPALLDAIVSRAAQDQDILVLEGSMGLFDGLRAPAGRCGATADLARRYGWPVILVINCSAMAQSAGAVALGFAAFDPKVPVAGVILNNVGSDKHRASIEAAFTRTSLKIIGALRRNPHLRLPERHLGLVQAAEISGLETQLEALADAIESNCDVPGLAGCAGGKSVSSAGSIIPLPAPGRRIAVASDAAFSFLYPHVLDGWRAAGAEIAFFSPLADEPPPDFCDACFLPGGYPELHAGRLASAQRFIQDLRSFAETRRVHGECGGYMVLGQRLIDADGVEHPMAGLLPVSTSFHERRLTLGYRRAEMTASSVWGKRGAVIMGHEFHYATMTSPVPEPSEAFATLYDGEWKKLGFAGHRAGNVSGTFFHAIAHAV